MARAVLRSDQFSSASDHRLRDAVSLLAAKRWTASIYLAGYGVECLQKAEVAAELRRIGGWLANQEGPLYSALWTHDLVAIGDVLAYPPQLMGDIRRLARIWRVDLRYSSIQHNRGAAEESLRLTETISKRIKLRLLA